MSSLPGRDSDRLRFFSLLADSLASRAFVRLVLSKPASGENGPGAKNDTQRLEIRAIELQGQSHLSFVHRHPTRDVTRNLAVADGVSELNALVGSHFQHAHLLTITQDAQLRFSKRGQCKLTLTKAERESDDGQHDLAKQRWVDPARPFLAALGVMNERQQPIAAMSRKWKQINKFVEVFAHALDASPLAQAEKIHIVDFGSGKGYLTFAVHDWLRHTRGMNAQVTGVELRPDMVKLCNGVVDQLKLPGLSFVEGDVRSWQPGPLDAMIALHACDTATDHALHLGVRAGASIVMCSPCCHKQIRPQLLSPHPLRPILQHGVHLGQEAEMVTDGLRALLLEASGYDTQVFEFISLEHTNKNKMILGVKRSGPRPADETLRQIAEIKRFYGIQVQSLESLLVADGLIGVAA